MFANNLQNFFSKFVQYASFCYRLSKKAKTYQNLTNESGSKQKFSLLKEICLRPILVELYKKKNNKLITDKKSYITFQY